MSIIKKKLERLISDKQQKLLELDPDRFFVENIRSFYNLTTPVAKFLCELAVKQGLFAKMFGLMCPNDDCGRMIKSYAPGEPIDNSLTCENCLIRGIVPNIFPSANLKKMTYYQLHRKDGTGLAEKMELDELKEEARKMKPSELNESGKMKHDKLIEKLKVAEMILNLFWKSMFSLAVLVAFVIVLVSLVCAKTLETRVPLAIVEVVITGTTFRVFDFFFHVAQQTDKNQKT